MAKEFRLELVAVYDLFVNCSLWMNDKQRTCNERASWAVWSKSNQSYLYRCTEHKDVLYTHPFMEHSDYTAKVPRRQA